MCIGVPARIVAVGEDIHQLASAEVSGVTVNINISLVCEGDPQALVGRWALVHVGFAMSLLDEQEALATLEALNNMRMVLQSYPASA